MLNWIFWAIPPQYVKSYFITLWLVMFIIPNYIFGLYFTKIGFIINLLWYDMIFYGWVRVKQTLGGDKE